MKSEALQALVKNIFSSEETKAQFMSDPNSAISKFDLSESEKKAVLATHAKLGLVTGNSTLTATAGPMSWWY